MTDLLAQAASFLSSVRKTHMSATVVYSRGEDSVELAATLDRSEHELATAEGFATVIESVDFLIAAADLVLNGAAAQPRRGDRIEYAGETYEVLDRPGLPAFRREDPHGYTLRVFCKIVEGD